MLLAPHQSDALQGEDPKEPGDEPEQPTLATRVTRSQDADANSAVDAEPEDQRFDRVLVEERFEHDTADRDQRMS